MKGLDLLLRVYLPVAGTAMGKLLFKASDCGRFDILRKGRFH
jgi:hypothetical protein